MKHPIKLALLAQRASSKTAVSSTKAGIIQIILVCCIQTKCLCATQPQCTSLSFVQESLVV
eukprot:1146547-Pelagomonas_calceolata.AAC.3